MKPDPRPRLPESLSVLYRDAHYVAVYKPAGLLVHRSEIDRHETRFALQVVRDQLGRRVFPVHRLDKPTAGLLLFALSAEAARRLGPQFEGGGVRKRYRAVVRGWTDPESCIDHPLAEGLDRYTDALADPEAAPKAAVTAYRRLATCERPEPVGPHPSARYSLLELLPRHGRKHQIRRHLKHVFHPVLGDTTYGDGRHNALLRRWIACHRLLLVATDIEFTQPFTDEPVRIATEPDAQFQEAVRALGMNPSS